VDALANSCCNMINIIENSKRIKNNPDWLLAESKINDYLMTLTDREQIQVILRYFPHIRFVAEQIAGIILSPGIRVSGNIELTRIIQDFNISPNFEGDMNRTVLRDAIIEMIIYGEVGVRFISVEEGFQLIPVEHYRKVVTKENEHPGYQKVMGYIVSLDGNNIHDETVWDLSLDLYETDFDGQPLWTRKEGVWVNESRKLMFLTDKHFTILRRSHIDGQKRSPLLNDRFQIILMMATFRQLIHDIEYDGPGRALLFLNAEAIANMENSVDFQTQVSMGGLQSDTEEAQRERRENIEKMVLGMAEKYKNANSWDVVALSTIIEDVKVLPRTVKGLDYSNFVSDTVEFVAMLLGFPPLTVGVGQVFGNVTMTRLLENIDENLMQPLRDDISVKLTMIYRNVVDGKNIRIVMRKVVDTMSQQLNDIETLSQAVARVVAVEAMADSGGVKENLVQVIDNTLDLMNKKIDIVKMEQNRQLELKDDFYERVN